MCSNSASETGIRLSLINISEADVKLAAQIAQSDDFIEAKPEGYKAVSYTHLDVYKRQDQNRAGFHAN